MVFLFLSLSFSIFTQESLQDSWLQKNLIYFSELDPGEKGNFPSALNDDLSAFYIKEMLERGDHEEAKRHFLLWYKSCKSSCLDFSNLVIDFLKLNINDFDKSKIYLDSVSSNLTYDEKSGVMFDFFFQKRISKEEFSIKEIEPYYQKLNSASPKRVKEGWASLMIFLLEEGLERKRADVEDVFNFIRVWNISFDYEKLGKISPHSDLKKFILSWGNYKSSKPKEAKGILKDWEKEGIANYHFLDYHSLNSKVSSSMGESQEALESLEKMAVNGGGEDGIYRKAGYLFYLNSFDEAENEYKRYLSRYPDGPRADLCRYHLFRLNVVKDPNIALSYISDIDDPDLQPNKLYWEYRLGSSDEKLKILLERYPFSFFSLYVFEKEGFSEQEWWKLVFRNSGDFEFRKDLLSDYEDLIPEIILKEAKFNYLHGERSYSNILRISSLLTSLERGIEARLYAGFLLKAITEGTMSEKAITRTLFNFWPTPYEEGFDNFNLGTREQKLLMYSLAHRESAFQPNAISSAGAVGLTQVMPSTALDVLRSMHMDVAIGEVGNLLKMPDFNLMVGTTYLNRMLERYDDDLVSALFAYNAGSSRVDSWLKRIGESSYESPTDPLRILTIPLSEPRIYARKILTNLFMYQRLDHYGLE